ncbi:MAG: glutathione S-transferase domain-containing protein [Solirubrobacteraceae bacterium]|nr:glutathione S-transferase domain-containing protein [Solirubrobacteraceae bacterium]
MRLYVCYGTFKWGPRKGGHPCGRAYHALRDAGHDPEVVRAYGFGALPDALNGPRRRAVKRATGDSWVPALVLDDGTVVDGSDAIVAWAGENAPVAAGA